MSTQGSSNFVDYYELLGIAPSAEIPEIRRAYIQKAKEGHPDTGGSDAMMQSLNAAYRTLMNSGTKAAYDMLHNFHTGVTMPSDYRYKDGRKVNDMTDMSDEEIDTFLDDVFTEYRNGAPKVKPSLRQWFKNFL